MSHYVIGIDGCRVGWLVVRRNLTDGGIEADIFPDSGSAQIGPGSNAAMIIVHTPDRIARNGTARQISYCAFTR